MTRSRVLFAACLVFVLTLVAVSWLWRQAPAWVAREVHERSSGRVSVQDVRLNLSGVRFGRAIASAAGFSASCENIEVPVSLLRAALPLPVVHVERCAVGESGMGLASPETAPAVQGVRESDTDASAQLRRYVQAVHVNSVVVEARGAAATLNGLVLTASAEGWELRLESGAVEEPEAIAIPPATVHFTGLDELVLQPAAPLFLRGVELYADRVQLRPQAMVANVEDARVSMDGWEVEVSDATLSRGGDGRPHLAASQTRITAPVAALPAFLHPDAETQEGSGGGEAMVEAIPAAAQEEAAEQCGEERRCRRPSELANALSDGVSRWADWPELRARLLDVALPDVDVQLDGVALFADGAEVLSLSTVAFQAGRLTVGGEVLGVQVEGSAPLRTLDEFTFRAQGVDVSLAGPQFSRNLRTWGTLNLAGTVNLGEQLVLRMTSTLHDAGFEWGAVSPVPVELQPLELVAAASLGMDEHGLGAVRVTVDVQTGEVPLVLEGALTQDDEGWMTRWRARLASSQPCARLWRAIPEGMLPNLGHRSVRFSGETEWTLGVDYRLGDPWSVELLSEQFPGTCEIVWMHRDYDPSALNSPNYVFHVTEGAEPPGLLVGPGTPGYVTLDSLPAYVGASMYLSEEIGFYNGVGVSLGLMRRAVAMDLDRGRYVYGGSTIMQQLVKNLYLSRAKTLSRKLEEAVIVWGMLTRVSKDRILEMYLNCIEFGPNIYGIRAASEYYFGKPPQWLTPLEAVYLANLKPSPRDGANHHRRGHSPTRGWWQERTRTILERLVEYTGTITPEEVDYYSPYILPLTGSPAWQASGYQPMERPEWAVLGSSPPVDDGPGEGSATEAP